jgi:Folate-dependent phosphoribosylglycinamide formyltransferase PurN
VEANLQSIIDAIRAGRLDTTIAVVVSDRSDAQGLQRARDAGIDAVHLNPRDFSNRLEYDKALAVLLLERRIALVCLAGFMRLVGRPLLDAFPDRILNIHPSLLPSFPASRRSGRRWSMASASPVPRSIW